MTSRFLPYLIVFAVGGVLAGVAVDRWQEREHVKELIALNNEAAEREGTLRTDLGNWIRRARIAEDEKDVAEAMSEEARRDAKAWKSVARQNHDLAITYRARWEAEVEATIDSTDTVIPLDRRDGSLVVDGEVRIFDHLVPPEKRIAVAMEVALERLGLEVTILEDDHGLIRALVSTDDPHVESVEVESIVDRRSTGLDAPEAPSRLRWFGVGGVVGTVACLLWCPTP